MQETPAAQAALSSPQTKCFTSLTHEQELWEELCASPLCQLPAPQQAELWSFVPRSSCPYPHLLQILKFQETTHIWDLFQVVLAAGEGTGTLPLQWPQLQGGCLKVMFGTSWTPGPPYRQLERDRVGPVAVGRAQCTKAP